MNLRQNAELSGAIRDVTDISKHEKTMHLLALGGWLAISEGSYVVHALGGNDLMSCAMEAGAVGLALLTEYARHERLQPYKEALQTSKEY